MEANKIKLESNHKKLSLSDLCVYFDAQTFRDEETGQVDKFVLPALLTKRSLYFSKICWTSFYTLTVLATKRILFLEQIIFTMFGNNLLIQSMGKRIRIHSTQKCIGNLAKRKRHLLLVT